MANLSEDYARLLNTHERLVSDYTTNRENLRICIRDLNMKESQLEACQRTILERNISISKLSNNITGLNQYLAQAQLNEKTAIEIATKAQSELEQALLELALERRSV